MSLNTFDDNEPLFAAHMNYLVNALNGDGIVSGCAISKGTGDFETDVTSGTVQINNDRFSVSADTVTHSDTSGLTSNEQRIDIITVDNTDTITVTEGTAAFNPTTPTIPTDEVLLGFWFIDETDTQLTTEFDIPASQAQGATDFVEDNNSPLTGSGSATYTINLADQWDQVKVEIEDLTNTSGGATTAILQVDGDTGTNYDHSNYGGGSSTGASNIPLTDGTFADTFVIEGDIVMSGAWDNAWSCRLDLFFEDNNDRQAEHGANASVTSPLDSITIGVSGTSCDLDARVFGRNFT